MLLPLLALSWTLAAAPTERRYVPCQVSSPEWTEARKRFEALDAKLAALPEDSSTHESLAALRDVLGSRCFELSRETKLAPETGVHALALATWWREGGRAWVASYLELGRPGVRTVVLPPEVRPVLTRDSLPQDHRLAPLLCAAGDAACARGTQDWYTRAEAAFWPENARGPFARNAKPGRQARVEAKCTAHARKKPKRWHYTAWRSCLDNWLLHERALPLVRLRAPEEGWLVLRGRRGHYDFCDEVRAYHLATGAAYVSQSCGGLALREGGHVDAARTEATRQARILAGTLSPGKLRELTWMMLLAPEARSFIRPRARVLKVPESILVEWREKDGPETVEMGGIGSGTWGHTGQTRLHWTWFPPMKGEPLSGEFTWPDSSKPEEHHIDVLLQEAEASLQEGCPPLPPPLDVLDFTQAPGVNGRDAPEGVEKTQDSLVAALRTWRPPQACEPSPPSPGEAR